MRGILAGVLVSISGTSSNEEEKTDMRRTWEDIRTMRDDQVLAERCLGALLDFSDREGKRLVLIVENLNMIFRNKTDEDSGWRLRKTLQTEPRIMLLASAISRFEEIDNPEQALYDLFRVLMLRPLSTQECATLWEKVSGKAPIMGKIRSLEILTGSNPRLLAIIAGFGDALSFRELMKDLFNLIDDHTEYFRSHLESLSAQERRVYLALARLWKPATTREVADLARLDTSQCSAQLRRLIERGVVLEKGGTPRRKRYYLTERLYNIYYLLRNGVSDQIVKALIHFMTAFYSRAQLEEIQRNAMIEKKSDTHHEKSIKNASEKLVQLLQEESDPIKEQYISNLMNEAKRISELGNYEEVIDVCDEIVAEAESSDLSTFKEVVAVTLMNKSISLVHLNRKEEAIAVCDDILNRFDKDKTPDIIEKIAQTMLHKANTLNKLNQISKEIEIYDSFMDKYNNINIPQVNSLIPPILINKAIALSQLNREMESIAIYDNIIDRFSNNQKFEIILANAFANKSAVLGLLDKTEESIVICDELMDRFGDTDSPEVLQFIAQSFMNKGVALIKLNRLEEALLLYQEVINKFDNNNISIMIACVAQALMQKSLIFSQINKLDKSLEYCDKILARFRDNEMPAIALSVAQALVHKANLIIQKDSSRDNEAIAIYNSVIDKFAKSDVPQIILSVAMAAINKGFTFWNLLHSSKNVDDILRQLDDKDVSQRDVQVILAFLSETGDAPAAAIRALLAFSISLGYESVLALIQESSLEDLLLPLVTAFRQEIGLETEVSQEVFEIAQDVRKGLVGLRR